MSSTITAYSYARFSSRGQDEESITRQVEKTKEVCIKKGWVLDKKLYNDRGVSAFKSKNRDIGQLNTFFTKANAGEVIPGSVLAIESLDRLTHNYVTAATSLFLNIINNHISIYTSIDSQLYEKKACDKQLFLVIQAVLVLIRAGEESQRKSHLATAG
jgi:DNA invertase Pin-like site-specific DNA recombinase